MVRKVASVARLLPALTATNAVEERARLVEQVRSGEVPKPRWRFRPRRTVDRAIWRVLDGARERATGLPGATHYQARLDELELELAMMEVLGKPRLIRPLAARRFGTGRTAVQVGEARVPLRRLAARLLADLPHREERREIPAIAGRGRPSLGRLMATMARAARLDIEVRVEPRLSAGAATGERTVFLADRAFGRRESLRFAVHEVLGHAVAAANARSQPVRLFEVGTAGSFTAQEGLCLTLEERAGVLDAYRQRVLAARVVAADAMHDGAAFGEVTRLLHRELGFSPEDSVALSERAFRGGGVARDVGYLRGWLAVRRALAEERITLDGLRSGRLGLAAAEDLATLVEAGLWRVPPYRPSLAESLSATDVGRSPPTSPPSFAASFTMLEET
jgi:hypothetical protein